MAELLPTGMAPRPAAEFASSPQPAPTAGAPPGLFHELLSDINPLQYIPVVGTIYRAVTGDEGNPALRFVASLGTSFAIGGPIGLAITVGEKLAGIDPERMVLNAATHLFHLGHAEAAPAAPSPPPASPSPLAFALNSHDMSADELNALELQRLKA